MIGASAEQTTGTSQGASFTALFRLIALRGLTNKRASLQDTLQPGWRRSDSDVIAAAPNAPTFGLTTPVSSVPADAHATRPTDFVGLLGLVTASSLPHVLSHTAGHLTSD